MSDELKACLCGEKAYIIDNCVWGRDAYQVQCKECGIRTVIYGSLESALSAWNTRPLEAALREQLEQAEQRRDAEIMYHNQYEQMWKDKHAQVFELQRRIDELEQENKL